MQSQFLVVGPLAASTIIQLIFQPTYTDTPTTIQPPGFVFGIVWTVIYLLYGLFLQRIATKKHPLIRPIAVIAGLNLLLNLIWSPLVFVYKRRVAGLYIIYALIATLLALLVMLDDKPSKLLLLPYLTWLVVASQLQLASLIQNN
jgi:translocator protein